MALVQKSVVAPYSAEQMYALVERVEDYPKFLPWCRETHVQRDPDGNTVLATTTMQFHALRHSFTTKNVHTPPESIKMNLVSGPFRRLTGEWTFTPLSENSCRVKLWLEYEFSSWLLTMTLGAVFDFASNSLISAFARRAREIYG